MNDCHLSDSFPVGNGVKLDYVLETTLFSIVIPMLSDAFRDDVHMNRYSIWGLGPYSVQYYILSYAVDHAVDVRCHL